MANLLLPSREARRWSINWRERRERAPLSMKNMWVDFLYSSVCLIQLTGTWFAFDYILPLCCMKCHAIVESQGPKYFANGSHHSSPFGKPFFWCVCMLDITKSVGHGAVEKVKRIWFSIHQVCRQCKKTYSSLHGILAKVIEKPYSVLRLQRTSHCQ